MARVKKGIRDKELAKLIRNLAKNLREIRQARGITQQTLAYSAQMAISTIWEIENEQIEDLRMSTITAIAQALKISAYDLIC
jgi:transcriptional regulator with XRE-family HTH domain